MSPEILTIGMFSMLLIAILLGVSLSFALGGTAVVFGLIVFGPNGMFTIISTMFGSMWSILAVGDPALRVHRGGAGALAHRP